MRQKWIRWMAAIMVFGVAQWAAAQELSVSAAASLNNAFTEIGKAFEANHPGVRVTFNFAASGVLLRQIEQGAPVDVFASADQETMDRAVEQALIVDGTRFDFAENTLVLIVPQGKPMPAKLADLQDRKFGIIAVGTPSSVPAGNYTQQVLQKAGLWNTLEPKFAYGENVRQVLQYVARNEADAGFVYGTDAATQADKVIVALTVPTLTQISYPMALVKATAQPQLARQFMQYVASEDGQKVLARYGFVSPQR